MDEIQYKAVAEEISAVLAKVKVDDTLSVKVMPDNAGVTLSWRKQKLRLDFEAARLTRFPTPYTETVVSGLLQILDEFGEHLRNQGDKRAKAFGALAIRLRACGMALMPYYTMTSLCSVPGLDSRGAAGLGVAASLAGVSMRCMASAEGVLDSIAEFGALTLDDGGALVTKVLGVVLSKPPRVAGPLAGLAFAMMLEQNLEESAREFAMAVTDPPKLDQP